MSTSKTPRRTLLKYLAATSAAVTQPGLATANSASRHKILTLLVPNGFQLDASHRAFEALSGLTLRLRHIAPHEEPATILQRHAIDLCLVSGHSAPYWQARELLAPWDQRELPQTTLLHEPLIRTALEHWRFGDRGPYWLPTVWGAEGICWRSDRAEISPSPSYADLWEGAAPNTTLVRPLSALQSVAYLLEDSGLLAPGSVARAQNQAAESRRVHHAALRYMTTYKDRVRATWNDAETQIQGLLEDGAVIGQGWDSPALALMAANEPIGFAAPAEGALCWSMGWVLARTSRQVDTAHAFLNACLLPREAGLAIKDHGFHAAVRGAEHHATETYTALYRGVFDKNAIARLRPLAQQHPWHREIAKEFAYRFLRT